MGRMWRLIDVEVVDSKGNRCPTALNTVSFTIDGPGEWRGGLAQDDDRPDNYILSRDLPVQCGINRVIVRSQTNAGQIELIAKSEGLSAATIAIASTIPDVDVPSLPSLLDRGPTPPGPSFHPTRRLLKIASATAGSNAEDAALSFDDDETTGWSNDGDLSRAWIEYKFAQPAHPSEAVLKLADWRMRSYPLRIKLDGQVLYNGRTDRSLGYVTLPLKAGEGSTLRIELTSPAAADGDGFNLVEVDDTTKIDAPVTKPATKSTTGPGTRRTPGALSIIEAEFYEALPE